MKMATPKVIMPPKIPAFILLAAPVKPCWEVVGVGALTIIEPVPLGLVFALVAFTTTGALLATEAGLIGAALPLLPVSVMGQTVV
jgi:hypothetical protein